MSDDLLKALYQFWSQFGIPAYAEESVPSDAVLPYITYSISIPEWKDTTITNARLWYAGTSYTEIAAKLDEISQVIGEGVSIKTDGGVIYLFKDNNFIQFQPYEASNDSTKVAYLSMVQHVLIS